MELTRTLFANLREITSEYKQKNKDTSIVRLLDQAIKSVDKAIRAMDTFLKKKGVDVGKVYQDAKDTSKGLVERARETLGKDKDGNEQSIYNGLKDRGKEIGSKLLDKFQKFRTTGTPPPEGQEESSPDPVGRASTALGYVTDKLSALTDKLAKLKDGGPPDLNGDGLHEESWVERLKNRMSRRKKEVDDEKADLAGRGKSGKKGGSGDGLLGKLLGLGGTIVSGIMSGFKFLAGFMLKNLVPSLVKGLISGMGGILTRLVPSLTGGLTGIAGNLIKGGLKGGLKLAGRGLLAAGRSALPFLGRAAMMGLRGAGMLLSGPAGWAIAGATLAYGGYKLYKYMNRNDISDNIYGKLTRLRLLTYGFNDDNKDLYSKVFELEMLMKENLKFNGTDGKLTISKPTEEQVENIRKLFGVADDDKEKMQLLNAWFSRRFIPAFNTYVTALWKTNNNVYLDSLESLGDSGIDTFLSNYEIPTVVYNQTQIPFYDQPQTTVKKEDVEAVLANIRIENRGAVAKSKKKPEEVMAQEVATQKAKEAAQRAVETAKTKAGLPLVKTQTTDKPLMMANAGAEGENKPSIPVTIAANPSSSMTSVRTAGGPLLPGDSSLVGITTKLNKNAIYNLDPDVFQLFTGMAKEYNSLTGKSINVNSGYRDPAEQKRLYESMPPGMAAKPGNSMHEYGLAIDIPGATTEELENLGLLRKYGFTASVGGEKWHIEPIGAAINYDKVKTDLTFRKQAIASSPGRGGGGYGLLANSKKGGRDVALLRSIFEGKVTETPGDNPEAVANNSTIGLPQMDGQSTTSGPTTPASLSSPILDANKNTVAQSASPSMALKPPTSSVATSNGMMGNGSEGENKPAAVGSGNLLSMNTGSGYANSVGVGVSPVMDLSRYANLSPVEAIKQASAMTGVSEETLMTFAKLESSLNANAGSKTSSATGLFQITGPTWTSLVKEYGPKYGLPPDADPNNPLYNALMAAEYAKKNLQSVASANQAGVAEPVALYLTHHFGPSGGKRVLSTLASNPATPMQNAVSSDAYNANRPALAGKTVGGYVDTLNYKFATAANTPVDAYKSGKGGASLANTQSPTSSTGSGGGFMAASYNPSSGGGGYAPSVAPVKPTVSNAAYDITRVDAPTKTDAGVSSQSVTPKLDTSGMENILNSQLSALTQMVTLMTSIDGKLNFDKLLGIPGDKDNTANQPQSTPSMRAVPSTAIDLTRKSIA